MALKITDNNFTDTVVSSNQLVVVDFWAEWCGPCRAIAPAVEELANEYQGRAVVGKVNVDECPEVSMKYGIRSIPTILFLRNGEVVDKQVGLVPKSELAKKIETHLNQAV